MLSNQTLHYVCISIRIKFYSASVQGVNFCPGEEIENVTTHDQVNNTVQPILFHLGRDPGEKYKIK